MCRFLASSLLHFHYNLRAGHRSEQPPAFQPPLPPPPVLLSLSLVLAWMTLPHWRCLLASDRASLAPCSIGVGWWWCVPSRARRSRPSHIQ